MLILMTILMAVINTALVLICFDVFIPVINFLHVTQYVPNWILDNKIILSFAVTVIIAWLFQTRLIGKMFGIATGARVAISRESKKLAPLLEEVQKSILKEKECSPLKVIFLISDNRNSLESLSLGQNIIHLTTGMLNIPDNELKAVLATELYYLHSKTSRLVAVNYGLGWLSIIIVTTLITFFSLMHRFSRRRRITLIWLVVLAGLILLFLKYSLKFLKIIINTAHKGINYQADEFSCKVGFASDLLKYLERKLPYDRSTRSLKNRITSRSMPIAYRIERVENFIKNGKAVTHLKILNFKPAMAVFMVSLICFGVCSILTNFNYSSNPAEAFEAAIHPVYDNGYFPSGKFYTLDMLKNIKNKIFYQTSYFKGRIAFEHIKDGNWVGHISTGTTVGDWFNDDKDKYIFMMKSYSKVPKEAANASSGWYEDFTDKNPLNLDSIQTNQDGRKIIQCSYPGKYYNNG